MDINFKTQLAQNLKYNIPLLKVPNSITVILHKMDYFKDVIDVDLMNKIKDQAIYVFQNNYDFRENGDLIRAVVLVSCL